MDYLKGEEEGGDFLRTGNSAVRSVLRFASRYLDLSALHAY